MWFESVCQSGPRAGLVAAGILAAVSVAAAGRAQVLEPGDAFPPLAAFELEGEVPDLGDAKVVIVDFWASWCIPCRASFPVYDQLFEEYASRGLVIVGVSVDQNAEAMERFLRRMKPAFPIVRDVGQQLVSRIKVPAMPTSFVLDGDEVVRFVHRGFHGERTLEAYRRQIESLISEQP